jgi:hypothetical protein
VHDVGLLRLLPDSRSARRRLDRVQRGIEIVGLPDPSDFGFDVLRELVRSGVGGQDVRHPGGECGARLSPRC